MRRKQNDAETRRRSRLGIRSCGRRVRSVIGGVLLVAVAVLAAGAIAPAAPAATSDLAVSYPADPVPVPAGGKTTVYLRVADVGKDPLTVNITPHAVKLMNNGQTQFQPQADPLFAGYLRIVPQRLTLKAGQQQLVKIFLQVPPGARPDDYFLGFMVTPEVTAGQVKAVNAVGALVVIEVPGPRGAKMTASYANLPAIVWGSSVTALVRARNVGVSTVQFTTDAHISGTVAPKPDAVRAEPHLLPPGLARDVAIHWSSWLGLGRYTVKTTLVYNKSSQTTGDIVLTKSVLVISPWWLLVPAGIIAVVVLLLVRRTRKRARRRNELIYGPPS